MRALMKLAFEELGLVRLHTEILEDNTSSIRLHCDKLGWKEEGRLRRHVNRHGGWHDAQMFGTLQEEYLGGEGR